MAKIEIDGVTELVRAMEAMGQNEGLVADAILMAGAEAAADVWRENAEKYGLRKTGAMIESIGYKKKPTGKESGRYIDVFPQGEAKHGKEGTIRNASKAYWTHYGEADRKGHDWITDVEYYADERVPIAEIDVWDQYLQTGEIPDAYYTGPKRKTRQ